MRKQDYDDDDGRAIADMSLLDGKTASPDKNKSPASDLSKAELRQVALNATLAGLAIAVVFIAAFALFILFCIHIWFS